jgi:hypothetical protein
MWCDFYPTHCVFSIPSPRLGDRKYATHWIKIISHHKPWEILYVLFQFFFFDRPKNAPFPWAWWNTSMYNSFNKIYFEIIFQIWLKMQISISINLCDFSKSSEYTYLVMYKKVYFWHYHLDNFLLYFVISCCWHFMAMENGLFRQYRDVTSSERRMKEINLHNVLNQTFQLPLIHCNKNF